MHGAGGLLSHPACVYARHCLHAAQQPQPKGDAQPRQHKRTSTAFSAARPKASEMTVGCTCTGRMAPEECNATVHVHAIQDAGCAAHSLNSAAPQASGHAVQHAQVLGAKLTPSSSSSGRDCFSTARLLLPQLLQTWPQLTSSQAAIAQAHPLLQQLQALFEQRATQHGDAGGAVARHHILRICNRAWAGVSRGGACSLVSRQAKQAQRCWWGSDAGGQSPATRSWKGNNHNQTCSPNKSNNQPTCDLARNTSTLAAALASTMLSCAHSSSQPACAEGSTTIDKPATWPGPPASWPPAAPPASCSRWWRHHL